MSGHGSTTAPLATEALPDERALKEARCRPDMSAAACYRGFARREGTERKGVQMPVILLQVATEALPDERALKDGQ